MARGQAAPLSLNEEITLRRVAHQVASWRDLPKRDLDHLEKLALIIRGRDRYTLTRLGKQRYDTLPRAAHIDSGPREGRIAALMAYVRSARR